jgi:hypothetical protein
VKNRAPWIGDDGGPKASNLAFKRPQGQAHVRHDGVPGSLFRLRIFKIKTVNHATRTAGKIASTIKDHSLRAPRRRRRMVELSARSPTRIAPSGDCFSSKLWDFRRFRSDESKWTKQPVHQHAQTAVRSLFQGSRPERRCSRAYWMVRRGSFENNGLLLLKIIDKRADRSLTPREPAPAQEPFRACSVSRLREH